MSERADEMNEEVFGLIMAELKHALGDAVIFETCLAVDIIRALNEAGYKIEKDV